MLNIFSQLETDVRGVVRLFLWQQFTGRTFMGFEYLIIDGILCFFFCVAKQLLRPTERNILIGLHAAIMETVDAIYGIHPITGQMSQLLSSTLNWAEQWDLSTHSFCHTLLWCFIVPMVFERFHMKALNFYDTHYWPYVHTGKVGHLRGVCTLHFSVGCPPSSKHGFPECSLKTIILVFA